MIKSYHNEIISKNEANSRKINGNPVIGAPKKKTMKEKQKTNKKGVNEQKNKKKETSFEKLH